MHTSSKNWIEAIEMLEGAYSPYTLRGYRYDFGRFEMWCDTHDVASLPATPETVARYVDELPESYANSTVKRRIAAIRKIHFLVNLPDPTYHEVVQIAYRRTRRRKPTKPKQALGLTQDLLYLLIASCDRSMVGTRDKALIAVGYDTLCRRSELIALRAQDIERSRTGARILVRRAKNDPFGSGRMAAISTRGLRFLDVWLSMAEIEHGPIFRPVYKGVALSRILNPYTVTRVLKKSRT